MKITLVLNNGEKYEFSNAEVQKKNDGRSTAVYDLSTFRIIVEYKSDRILACQASDSAISNNQTDVA